MTAAVLSPTVPASQVARPSGPSFAKLTGLEIRKSLSTRSGKSVAVASTLLAPIGIFLVSLNADGTAPGATILGISGMLTALVLLAPGVLSTAGEWSNRSIQTSFLLVPQRGRVLAAKGAAVGLLGALFAAVSVGLSTAILTTVPEVAWDNTGQAIVTVVASGAAFAVIGAGIGATVGNAPAALTGTYLTVLGILPVVSTLKPALAEKLDPAAAVVTIAEHGPSTMPVLVITGWVVVSTIAGTLITKRRSVA
jgi:ABC-2 type transport system permease protein